MTTTPRRHLLPVSDGIRSISCRSHVGSARCPILASTAPRKSDRRTTVELQMFNEKPSPAINYPPRYSTPGGLSSIFSTIVDLRLWPVMMADDHDRQLGRCMCLCGSGSGSGCHGSTMPMRLKVAHAIFDGPVQYSAAICNTYAAFVVRWPYLKTPPSTARRSSRCSASG